MGQVFLVAQVFHISIIMHAQTSGGCLGLVLDFEVCFLSYKVHTKMMTREMSLVKSNKQVILKIRFKIPITYFAELLYFLE